VDRASVERWIDGYRRAWETNDPADVAFLFTEDALYYTAPYREPWRGRDEIVAGWLDRKDEQGDWSFRHEVVAVCEDVAFVRGWTEYRTDSDYANLWMIRLPEDGRCSEFVEWWMAVEGTTPV
jgi:uncharacterized protein (TIGR02246 family)